MYSVSPRTPEGGQAGKGDKPPLLHILRSRDTHTQLLLATFKGGMWRRKKRGVAITRGKQDEGMIFG
ncbi:phosphinothricin acetyltransferase [Capnocytophaga sp. oral taxon 903]|uniref:phosphinothricin acetyltransferase n=1 Tax=Capnocytophaga sp. oral taxon 903 TaxID=2748317 RepID=UPI00293C0C1C|nr:phosphinothricin acetyltransferase [Capnocytophaga sp. oral taxon 903]